MRIKNTQSTSKVLKSVYMDRLYGVFLIVLSAVSFGAMAIFARIASGIRHAAVH